jgi:hypothetical protein
MMLRSLGFEVRMGRGGRNEGRTENDDHYSKD